MKRLIALTGILLFICLLISAAADTVPLRADATEPSSPPASAEKPPAVSTPEKLTVSYVLRSFRNRVAVFEKGSDVPIYITPTRISDLPEEDRRLLRVGITAPDKKALKRLLEDYCS